MTSVTGPADTPPQTDNFYSPANFAFYARQPYRPLDNDTNSIRLLKVSIDTFGQLQCRLTDEISLAEALGTFSAISYCAGDAHDTRLLRVDGQPFNAFANLAHALEETYRYRSEKHGDVEATVWADQICINQSDPLERAHQVSFMHKIYEMAHEVIVALSTEKQRGGPAIPWIKEVYEHLPKDVGHIKAYKRKPVGIDSPLTRFFWSQMRDQNFESIWVEVLQMFKQPWWTRVWTFQEYMSATNATFLYGGQSVPASDLTEVHALLCTSGFDLFNDAEYLKIECFSNKEAPNYCTFSKFCDHWAVFLTSNFWATTLLEEKEVREEQGSTNILTMLWHSLYREASDARDHVYAFLGIAHDNYGLVIDYSPQTTLEEVFTEMTRKIISHDRRLRVLYQKDVRAHGTSIRLPSWVPDWASKPSGFRLQTKLDTMYTRVRWPGSVADASFFEGGTVLEISGLLVDTLTAEDVEPETSESYLIFQTVRGYRVETSCAASAGDELWILYGGRDPFVLRRQGPAFELINEAAIIDEPGGPWEQHYTTLRQQPPVRIRII